MSAIEWIAVIGLTALTAYLVLRCFRRPRRFMRNVYRTLARAVRRLCTGAAYYLLWLFPRDKRLILFTSDEGEAFNDNPKYLFQKFIAQPGFRCVWITRNADVYDAMKQSGYEVCMLQSRQGRWMQLRAGTLIHSNSLKEEFNYILAGGATSINCWHGVGLKRVWYRNKNAFSGKWTAQPPSLKRSYHLWWAGLNRARRNYVISTSEEVSAYYPATYNVPMDHVLNLGQARNDVFFDDTLEEGTLPPEFQKGKVIVYMPTYRAYNVRRGDREMIGSGIDLEKLSAMLKKYGYTFVIKQHRFNTQEGAEQRRYENIVDISSLNYALDPQLLLKYTDILITDYSSAYTDFLLLDRPVLFYCYDLEDYLSQWELNFDYDYVTPGPKVFSSDELIAALEKILQGQDEYVAERQRVKRVFYSPENQGPVAQKQMDYIIDNIIKR